VQAEHELFVITVTRITTKNKQTKNWKIKVEKGWGFIKEFTSRGYCLYESDSLT